MMNEDKSSYYLEIASCKVEGCFLYNLLALNKKNKNLFDDL
jgi:hypothetical protein